MILRKALCVPSSFHISPVWTYQYHFHCYFSSPIELNKTVPSFCTHKFDISVFFTFSISIPIWCFCLLLSIQITITNYNGSSSYVASSSILRRHINMNTVAGVIMQWFQDLPVWVKGQCKEPRGKGSSGAMGVHKEDGCLHDAGELPLPPRLFLMLNIVLLIASFLEKQMGSFPRYHIFIFQERETEDRRRGGGRSIQGQEIKKEVQVSEQCKSRAKTSIAHNQQQQLARGRTNANTQNALMFSIPYRTRTSPQKSSLSFHGGLRCHLTGCA